MYGCGDTKLAKTLGKPEKQGKKYRDIFWKANPAIKKLIDELEKSYDSHPGWIYGIDGRKLRVRDKRKLLNCLLQNAATVVFKKWMVAVDKYKKNKKRTSLQQVISYHDETQNELYSDEPLLIEAWSSMVRKLARQVGVDMKLNVPIEADCKVGKNWRDTH